MPIRQDKFVHDENLRRYAQQIEVETDPRRLAMLRALLKEEKMRPGGASVPNK